MNRPASYLVSVPERLLRSLSALSGGLLREVGGVVLPARLRRTALYRAMVEVTLRFLIENLGQVEGVYANTEDAAQNFVLQRTASHGIEILGLLTLHVSPVWVLAALADAVGAGHQLLGEISQSLKDDGLLPQDARFESMDQLLDALEQVGTHLALTLNMPPVDIAGLHREWRQLKTELTALPAASLPPIEDIQRTWQDLKDSSKQLDRSVFAVSTLMAFSALARVPSHLLWLTRAARSAAIKTGEIVGRSVLDHYTQTLREIKEVGYSQYWQQEYRPYLRAAARQFSPAHQTVTERLLNSRSRYRLRKP